MWQRLFGEIGGGQLGRLAYATALAVILGIQIAVGISIAFAAGSGDPAAAGDPFAALGAPLAIVAIAVMLVLTFANLNISAKRWRAIGLAGWPTVLGVVAVSLALQVLLGQAIGGVFSLAVLLVLLFAPNGGWQRVRGTVPPA